MTVVEGSKLETIIPKLVEVMSDEIWSSSAEEKNLFENQMHHLSLHWNAVDIYTIFSDSFNDHFNSEIFQIMVYRKLPRKNKTWFFYTKTLF